MIKLNTIKNIARIKKSPPKTTLTGNGVPNLLFILVKGEVGVYQNYRRSNEELVRTLTSGDVFADPGLLREEDAVFTTVSLSETIVIPVEKGKLLQFIQEEPALTQELLKELLSIGALAQAAEKNTIDAPEAHQEQVAEATETPLEQQTERVPPEEVLSEGADVPSEEPVPPEESTPGPRLAIYPEGHGNYRLPLESQNTALLMQKTHSCPICKTSFTKSAVRPSKLVVASTDKDLRSHYKGIEPMYFDVLTCPSCLYSALPEMFELPEKSKSDILKSLTALKTPEMPSFGGEMTTETVFAGYYLAVHCAPLSFVKFPMTLGKLYYKLSRLYADLGDEEMERISAQKALDNYFYAYTHIEIPENQEQQICVLLGELYLKQNDYKNALSYFSKAKVQKNGNPVMKSHAENRAYEIRELVAKK